MKRLVSVPGTNPMSDITLQSKRKTGDKLMDGSVRKEWGKNLSQQCLSFSAYFFQFARLNIPFF